jgi:DNA-binding NtrC family response regulator
MPPLDLTIDEIVDAAITRRSGRRLVVADDDDAMRALCAAQLREDGYEVVEARSGSELVRAIHRFEHVGVRLDLILTDVRMPGFDGLEVLEYLKYARLSVPVIVMTAFGDARVHREAEDLDAVLVLDKPFDLDEMSAHVARVLAG